MRLVLVPGVALALLGLNASLLVGLDELRRPAVASGADRDYHRFLYAYARERRRGMAYLRSGSFLEYDVLNTSGKRFLPLTVFSVAFSAFRETLARLICLLISLGYGIVMNVLTRYFTKIGLLCFLFFIANGINKAAFYIN